jgi:uncharacterized membrane protein YcaP (DUF421 family)
MKSYQIDIRDIDRILFGQAPPEFLWEVLIRTIIIYTGTLVIVKLLGKRMKAQLTITEMAVMIMMGAIISLPMQTPDKGILQGLFILAVITILHVSFNFWTLASRKIEQLTQRKTTMLVKDGLLQLAGMRKANVSMPQLFAELRSKKIYNLGEVQRMYMEDCGTFSVYKFKERRAGLSTLPAEDTDLDHMQHGTEVLSCQECGSVTDGQEKTCTNCGSQQLKPAVYE